MAPSENSLIGGRVFEGDTMTIKIRELPGIYVYRLHNNPCDSSGFPRCKRQEDVFPDMTIILFPFTSGQVVEATVTGDYIPGRLYEELSAESAGSYWTLKYYEEHGWICRGGFNKSCIDIKRKDL